MRRRAALAIFALAGLWCLWAALWRPLDVEGTAPADGYARVSGAVHVHTTLSDGGGTPDDVAAAAKRAGLQFVAITDHNVVDAKPFEGYHDGVLVIVGSELSTTAGHIVGLGIGDPVYRFSGDGRDGLEDVRDLGGAAFAAHPTSPREDFRWTGWDLPGPWGIEVMNGDSQWRSAGAPRLLRAAAAYPFNPPYALAASLTAPTDTLKRWDELLARRAVPGIIGADAHQRTAVGGKRSLPAPSYESSFRLVRNHVLLDRALTGSAAEDARSIVDALARGRSYVGVDALADAAGISFVAEAGGERWTMGDSFAPRPGVCLSLSGRMPGKARAVILKDGRAAAEGRGGAVLDAVAPGVYRGEVWIDGWDVPWVLTNAIVVAAEATLAKRREAAEWPPEPPAPAAVIDTFDEGSLFSAACDSASRLRAPGLDPAGGEDGKGAALLDFAIAEPTPGHPDVFCALVDERPRDLTGRGGITFAIRGDREYRLWFQVRDANPASADGGTEWWFTSVKATAAWRRVAVPFARLRSINPNTDGRLDLDQVRALVFVLDKGSVKPGTEGRIWIDGLAAY